MECNISPGEEILSCYEDNAHNGKLLVEWGFVEDKPSEDGVNWSPRGILDRSTIRTFAELLSSTALQELSQGSSKRIRPSSQTRPGLLNVYADGRASINLVMALALPHVLAAEHDLEEEFDVSIGAIISELEDGLSNLTSRAQDVLQSLQDLLKRRLAELHLSETALDVLEQELAVSLRRRRS